MLNCVERREKTSYTKLSFLNIHDIVQKKRRSYPFLFTMVYTEPSGENALSKHFSNKSFLHRLGHTKESIRVLKIWVWTKPWGTEV